MHRICVCGKPIVGKCDLCRECARIYGVNCSVWPEWLRFLVADLKREHRSEISHSIHDVHYSELQEL